MGIAFEIAAQIEAEGLLKVLQAAVELDNPDVARFCKDMIVPMFLEAKSGACQNIKDTEKSVLDSLDRMLTHRETLPNASDDSCLEEKANQHVKSRMAKIGLPMPEAAKEACKYDFVAGYRAANQESPPQAAPTKVEGWVIEAIENMLSAHWNLYSDHWKHIPTLTPDDDICRKDLKRALDWLKALTLTTEGESTKSWKELRYDEMRPFIDELNGWANFKHFIKTGPERIAELEAELKEQARLNGMGSEREAGLRARIVELEHRLKGLEK